MAATLGHPIAASRAPRRPITVRQPAPDVLAGLLHFDNFLYAALLIDLLAPLLIDLGYLPGLFRYVSQGLTAAVVGVAYARMMVVNRFPAVVWWVAGLSLLGFATALANGQGFAATLWGWWTMFEFPLVGLYIYLSPTLPDRFPQRLRQFCVAVLVLQMLVQLGQFQGGTEVGDNLAGTFGRHGVGPLGLFSQITLCLALGAWLIFQRNIQLIGVLAVALVVNILAANKIFPLAAIALLSMATFLNLLRRGRRRQVALQIALAPALFLLFAYAYNVLVPSASRGQSMADFLFDAELRNEYLFYSSQSGSNPDIFVLGRSLAAEYGWETIRHDPSTLLLGFGLGARAQSNVLGVLGIALEQGQFGLTRGTSLLIFMQEVGLVGLSMVAGFLLFLVLALWRQLRSDPDSPAAELRYGLLLFTLCWPLWLWYNIAWEARVAMLVYWCAMGYVFHEANARTAKV
jgi:hypothetical protein